MADSFVAGAFIVFEGPEGAGKSTQIGQLLPRLQRHGYDIVSTREPGGTPASDAIRQVILDPALQIDALSEFLLYSASRSQHVIDVIQPALMASKVVICDRFTAASVAYQGYGRGLDLDFIASLNQRATVGITPDLTLLLDLDVELGLARVAARGAKDRLERADLAFHQRVRQGFIQQAKADASWQVIDARQDIASLHEEIWESVRQCLKQHRGLRQDSGLEPREA